MKKKINIILIFEIILLSVLALMLIYHFVSFQENKQSKNWSVSTTFSTSINTDKSNNEVQHSQDVRHVFSVPYGNDMMNGTNSSNVFFTVWTLDDFETWITNYKNLSYTDKMNAKSSFGTSYTFVNLNIENDKNDLELTFDSFVQEHWFYFNTVSDFIEKHGKNADPKNIQ